ncbi:MAG: alpha/beta hydrolase [Parvularculales bacterium]
MKPIEQVLAFLAENQPTNPNETPQERRAGMEEALGAFPVPDGVSITPVDADGVSAEWVAAPGVAEDRVILYLHGGGYVIGSPKTHRTLTAKLSETAGARVLAIDYRLAPEHPFPAAVEDALTAWQWLLGQGLSSRSMGISGDSAGGGLTMALLLEARDKGVSLPAAAAPISPWVDLTGEAASIETRADADPMISREPLLEMAAHYTGASGDARHPLVSPIFADLTGLPPLLIHVGDAEVLLDDSLTLHDNALKANVPSRLKVWDEMIHVFQVFHSILPEGVDSLNEIGQFFCTEWGKAKARNAA